MPNNKHTVFDCNIIHLRRIHNRAGNITPVENNMHIPFDVKRVFYIYDIPGGESRAAHGHHKLHQFVVAAGGSFDITVDDGENKKTVQLNRPYMGFHILPGIWADLSNFSSGAVCLVLASLPYDPEDYIANYEAFKLFKKA